MDKEDKDKVEAIEKLLISDKPWQLKGEVGARARPLNSLLWEDVRFEKRIKAPELTEESLDRIESMIKQRIKDARFDDPIKKVKPAAQALSRHVEVSAEKSKISLAQIYERELLSKTLVAKPTDGPEKIVERKLAALCRKLDALCQDR